MAQLEASIAPGRLGALSAGMMLQGSLHPEEPHWYLPWIGVRPEAQGKGVGSALLARGLARADADGLPAYLEATSRRNAALYARYGFEVRAIVEAEAYPEIILMWRPAGGGAGQERSPAAGLVA
jgi:ribosomal protein S18 acetylase RimI-like enzyme